MERKAGFYSWLKWAAEECCAMFQWKVFREDPWINTLSSVGVNFMKVVDCRNCSVDFLFLMLTYNDMIFADIISASNNSNFMP